jgi:hypothetical protein
LLFVLSAAITFPLPRGDVNWTWIPFPTIKGHMLDSLLQLWNIWICMKNGMWILIKLGHKSKV